MVTGNQGTGKKGGKEDRKTKRARKDRRREGELEN